MCMLFALLPFASLSVIRLLWIVLECHLDVKQERLLPKERKKNVLSLPHQQPD